MMRILVGMALAVGFVSVAAASASGASGSAVPLAGNWEGTGPHGAPLSFRLIRRAGHLTVSSLAVGYPESCPALARDAEAVPVVDPVYAGPGARTSPASGAAPVEFSGRVPGSAHRVLVRGAFTSPGAGSLSVQIRKSIGCGWPDTTLTWAVHRAARRRVVDGTWTGALTATGLINGNVRFVVGADGRVIDSMRGFFTCITDTTQSNENVGAAPAYEFIRPDGSFLSPLNVAVLHGDQTTWSGRFAGTGLTGTLTMFDNCTNHLIQARFAALRTAH